MLVYFKNLFIFFFKELPDRAKVRDSLTELHKQIKNQVEDKAKEKKKKEYNWIGSP